MKFWVKKNWREPKMSFKKTLLKFCYHISQAKLCYYAKANPVNKPSIHQLESIFRLTNI